eukprot:CAMPEP_0115142978 /NCGR_PEP_ID=MMETSP0227-20121206/60484_1 /TAXON_ID=89957 /ORGANISM="Polarella glacialis, Strain CCMP 1383" /LENGTH=45 /DNA_ID= /DNA_START= /DNA_END= /DNA_ORIENTATION=
MKLVDAHFQLLTEQVGQEACQSSCWEEDNDLVAHWVGLHFLLDCI